MPPPTENRRVTERDARWALVRVLLGSAQMSGAVVSAMLLYQTGVTANALTAVMATCAATSLSVILFGHDRPRGLR